jgi:uracil-DNA glycosylase
MKIPGWEFLNFFNSGEWQVCDERLKDLERINRRIGHDGYNPGRKSLFKALQATPYSETRVAILGQDPYPQERFATGLAFSIPASVPASEFPPTLQTMFTEYQKDLHYVCPSTGDLTAWTSRGVLLWNTVPSCGTNQSLSHDWLEWSFLTSEIIKALSEKGVVFALLGQVARRHLSDIDITHNSVILTSHPSPRGSRSSNTPFLGSRLFSTINDKLNDMGLSPVDWKLP